MRSNLTTLCYIENDDAYLMMHRDKKEVDINKDKWIGVGGHFEKNESPEECLRREVMEETSLKLTSWKLRGVITFITDDSFVEYMFLYTAEAMKVKSVSVMRELLNGCQRTRSATCQSGRVIRFSLDY